VKVRAPWGLGVPIRFRIDVAGTVASSSFKARPPRRTLRQWLRRRPLPPGRTGHIRPRHPAIRPADPRATALTSHRAALILTDPDVVVVPVVAVHGAQVPWDKVVTQGVPVVAARRLPSMLRQLPAVLGPERIRVLVDQARVRFQAAA
jgi:hypothetical protein